MIENGWITGNKKDGKHYWLTPPDVYKKLNDQYCFDFDPCPFPKPDNFDGLDDIEWGKSSYVNPPFFTVMHKGKKKGVTAWVRKGMLGNGQVPACTYVIGKMIMEIENGKII